MKYSIDTKLPDILPVEVYDPEDNLIVTTTDEILFSYIRAQIKQLNVEGFYIIFDGGKIPINRDGNLPFYPDNLFPLYDELLSDLTEVRFEKKPYVNFFINRDNYSMCAYLDGENYFLYGKDFESPIYNKELQDVLDKAISAEEDDYSTLDEYCTALLLKDITSRIDFIENIYHTLSVKTNEKHI